MNAAVIAVSGDSLRRLLWDASAVSSLQHLDCGTPRPRHCTATLELCGPLGFGMLSKLFGMLWFLQFFRDPGVHPTWSSLTMTGPARIWRRVNQDFAWIGWRTVGTGMKWRRRVLLGLLGGFKAEFVSILSDFLSDSKVCQSWFTVDAVGNRTQQFQDGDGALPVARTPFFRRICWSLQTANVPWKRHHGGSHKMGGWNHPKLVII